MDSGIYSMEDLKAFGKKANFCPYYLARYIISKANIVVYNYMYLLDPKISDMIGKDMASDSIVIFDEAHNIDDVCIEAYTLKINKYTLEHAGRNIEKIKNLTAHVKAADMNRLEAEYQKLIAVELK